MISGITAGGYVKSATETDAKKSAGGAVAKQETAAGQSREDTFVRTQTTATTETTDITDYRSLKKLSDSQLKTLKNQRTESMRRLVTEMLGQQATVAKTAESSGLEVLSGVADSGQSDWMSQYLSAGDTPETAAQAISKDGAWGVDAVATRLLNMAVSLSGGDTAKIAELRGAVEAGFKAAGDTLGGELPGVCQDTYAETMKRFDYWEEHGSLEGYVMQDAE